MGFDIIIGIIFLVVVLILELFAERIFANLGIGKLIAGHQVGSKLMVAFLAGFIFFVLFTDKIPQPGQKIPVIIISLLLIWANLFLLPGYRKENQGNREEGK